MASAPPPHRQPPASVPGPTVQPPLAAAGAFPPAEARAARTPEQARQLAWRVLGTAFAAWLLLAATAVYALVAWVDTSTVQAAATLQLVQGIVLFQDRGTAPLLNAWNGMALQEGDVLEVKDNSLARLELPDRATLYLGPGTRLALAELRAGRFNAAAGQLTFEHMAGTVRAEVTDAGPNPLELETPYGTVRVGPGDYVVAVQGPRAQALVREGAAVVSVGTDTLVLAAGERAELAANAPAEGPLAGPANLVRNGDFSGGTAGWQPRDTQETNHPDRLGDRTVVRETRDGATRPALRVRRESLFETHNETGLVQQLNADVSVYPHLVLTAQVKVRAASLSGGGYLGTEFPLMLRLRYRDAAGEGQVWYRGFYYQNPERRPAERGQLVAQDTWTSVRFDLAELPERPMFLYALEVLGAGHDFDAVVADIRLVAE